MWVWTLIYFSASVIVGVQSGPMTGLHSANPDAKRLYDDLLSNYNKLVRPVVNTSDILTVRIKLKLSQLIDVNLKNQIMTTNLWVEQYWYDYKLQWEPSEYGGVTMLHVPSDHIWRPDIVLYNNCTTVCIKRAYKKGRRHVSADGNFEVTLATKATLYYNGLVAWKPPAIYKSSCTIDVEYFPFDEQTCIMKFGSWTYDGFQVDLRHLDEVEGSSVVEIGIDLTEFYVSVEWDILEVPAVRSEKFYTCCDEPYLDITFNITMRRKTLFYTVNLIIPCMGISFLTILTFYLPSDSGEKVTLSISILISLHVFFLLVVEIIPPTSLVVPLLGKYLIFAMILVSISICVTVVVLNVHFRSPQTHKMAPWVKRVFIHILPRLLVMRRPQFQIDRHANGDKGWDWSWSKWMVRTCNANGSELRDVSMGSNSYRPESQLDGFGGFHKGSGFFHRESSMDRDSLADELPRLRTLLGAGDVIFSSACRLHGTQTPGASSTIPLHPEFGSGTLAGSTTLRSRVMVRGDSLQGPHHRHCTPDLHKSCFCVRFIAEHTRLKEQSIRVKEDWKYVAMVVDRLFLWIFTLAVLVGTAAIILQAPSLYDERVPIDKALSEIAGTTLRGRNAQ